VAPIPEEIELPQLVEEDADNDQWAFFDPRQYGFPALLAKLESIAGGDNSAAG
jgi:hypothetical protein